MMKDYGIHHRISSVANQHANARAELGVKTVKRMLRDNMSARGTLDTALVSSAVVQLRNTPDRDTKLSPAKALFGRELRDFLPRPSSALMGELWMNLADAREMALGRRSMKAEKQWSEHTRALPPLKVGDSVMIQNQRGNHPLRWDKRGTVVKCEGFDQYQVMVDGSRRLTRRNRKFLRLFTPYIPTINVPQMTVKVKPTMASLGREQQPRVVLPGHTQQEQAQVQPRQQPVHQQAQDQYGGFVRNRLEDCPQQGGVRDLLEWAIPAAPGADVQEQGHPAQDSGPQEPTQQGAAPGGNQEEQGIRRSTRQGRGQTSKYEDFVRAIEVGASATYAQIVSGLGGRGRSW